MKKRYNYFKGLLPIVALMAVACTEESSITEQDTSWQIDQEILDDDIRNDYDPYATLLHIVCTETSKMIIANYSDGVTTLANPDDQSVTFTIRTTKVLDRDVNVSLIPDFSLNETYPNGETLINLPSDSFEVSEATLLAGEMETTMTLSLANIERLTDLNGYILPLKLVSDYTSDTVKVSKSHGAFIYHIFIRENYFLDTNDPIVGTPFNSTGEVTMTASNTYNIDKLYDGLTSGTYWMARAGYFLNLAFKQQERVKGIIIHTYIYQPTYKLKSFNLEADFGAGFIDLGTFTASHTDATINVNFSKILDVKALRLTNMVSHSGGTYPMIYEIQVVRE